MNKNRPSSTRGASSAEEEDSWGVVRSCLELSSGVDRAAAATLRSPVSGKILPRNRFHSPTMSFVQDLALLATAWGHVLLAPYTKVEESFNLHAVHDVLMYGIGPEAIQKASNMFDSRPPFFLKFAGVKYDHKMFPGAVPRTFIGSVLLAWLSIPIIKIAAALDLIDSKVDLQTVGECRLIV